MSFEWAFFGMTYNDCNRLSEALSINTTLRQLSLRNSEIDDPKMEIICKALSSNNTLEHLGKSLVSSNHASLKSINADVQHNHLTSASSSLFTQIPRLQYLDVSSNKLQRIECPSTLETLFVHLNPLGDAGITELLESLPSSKLKTLRVDACGLSRESMGPLFSYLSESTCVLKRLNMGNNRDIGEYGGKMIYDFLSSPPGAGKLVQCEVRGCEIETETETAILGAARQVARGVKT